MALATSKPSLNARRRAAKTPAAQTRNARSPDCASHFPSRGCWMGKSGVLPPPGKTPRQLAGFAQLACCPGGFFIRATKGYWCCRGARPCAPTSKIGDARPSIARNYTGRRSSPDVSDIWGRYPAGGGRRRHFPLDNFNVIGYHVGIGIGPGRLPAGAHRRVTE
jgi:hypothetical protein